jgi:hypothetical protein
MYTEKNIFFNGGGFTGFYEHIGAINYIRENKLTFDKYYGLSAGTAAALMLLLDIEIDEVLRYVEFEINKQTTDKHFDMTLLHIKACTYCIKKTADAYRILNNKMYIGITLSTGFIWKSEFESNIDLCNALLCSGNIPMVSSYDAKIGDITAIDGSAGCPGIPSNTLLLHTTFSFPVTLIYPSIDIIKYALIYNGYRNIKYRVTRPLVFSVINGSSEIKNILLLIEELMPKKYTIADIITHLQNKDIDMCI